MIVSCSNGGDGGSNITTIKVMPKNKYTSWEQANNGEVLNTLDKFESNAWIGNKILGRDSPLIYYSISTYITIKDIETQIVDPLNQITTLTLQSITNSLNINKIEKIFQILKKSLVFLNN